MRHKHSEPANKHAHEYSIEDLESSERDSYQQPEKVIHYLGSLKGKTIMDLGAGSGYFSVKLAKAGANVIAADVSDEFRAYLEKRIEENQLKNIKLRKIPSDSPGLKNNEVDMVLIVNAYHHIENRSDYFVKVKQGTKKEGELVIIDFFKTKLPVVAPPMEMRTSIDEVVAELKAGGYKNFEVEVNLLPYQYIIRAS